MRYRYIWSKNNVVSSVRKHNCALGLGLGLELGLVLGLEQERNQDFAKEGSRLENGKFSWRHFDDAI